MDKGIRGSQLHSELKFFDDQDKLSIIPDITILDTADLSIFHSVNVIISPKGIKYEKYRTKSFEFGGNVFVIELKFCRNEKGIKNKDIASYRADLEKLNNLNKIMIQRSHGKNKLYGLFVIFNKTDLKAPSFNEFMKSESEHIKLLYCTGKVHLSSDVSYLMKF